MSISVNPRVRKKMDLYESDRRYYRTFRDDWLKNYKQYRSILDADTSSGMYKWRSRLFVPATARAVDGLLPDMMLTLFAPNPWFNVIPREPQDVDQAEEQQVLLEYQFEQADIKLNFYKFLIQWAVYGTTFGKVYWKKDQRSVRVKERSEFFGIPFGEEKYHTKDVVLYDNPCFEPIDIFDITVSQRATSLSDTYVFHRTEKTLGECKRLQKLGIYKNVDDMEALILAEQTADNRASEERRLVQGLPPRYSKDEGDLRRIEILEYWNEDRTKTCTIGGGLVELKPERVSPFLEAGAEVPIDPFVMGSMWELPFEIYAPGVPAKCADLQSQLNTEVNRRQDNNNIRQNVIVKVRRGANVNIRNTVSKPGAIWLTDDMDAIDPVVLPELGTQVSFAEENLLKQEVEEITGVTKYVTGAGSSGSRRTATEVSVLSRMASKAFAMWVQKIEQQALKPVIRKFYQLNQLYMDEPKVVRITGTNKFRKIPPLDVGKNFDVICNASSELVDKGLKAQQMIQFFQMNQGNPIVQQNLLKKIYTLWGEKDYDQLNLPAEQAANRTQEAQLESQKAEQQALLKAATQGGQPVAPTGVRPGSPQEGSASIALGGGGERPGY